MVSYLGPYGEDWLTPINSFWIGIFTGAFILVTNNGYGYGTTSVGLRQPWSADVFLCWKVAVY